MNNEFSNLAKRMQNNFVKFKNYNKDTKTLRRITLGVKSECNSAEISQQNSPCF